MELKTKYHGIHKYEKEDVIEFENGIPGFENLKRYILFPIDGNEAFKVLHSIEDSEIGIVVISPFEVLKDYELKLSNSLLNKLRINSYEEVLVLTTVNLNSNYRNITTNLRAPIIINIKEKIGEQIILNTEKYLIKHPVFKEES
ncbi:flagellar assembly protein FliW [Haloimpatiens sp. FM7315]|uniref:flagellar assembly protein FliW n=1 Tax=Haloimpatiens sp. FM7315 TaxID=3298609 RepID=UPI0035A2E4BD